MDVLCVGMYRACSTWQYDIAAHLVEEHRSGRRLGFVLGDDYTNPLASEMESWRQTSRSAGIGIRTDFQSVQSTADGLALHPQGDFRTDWKSVPRPNPADREVCRHDCWRVLKSHDGHDAFASSLHAGRAVALYAYRDLRDVAFSLVHRFGASFEEVHGVNRMLHVCLRNDAFWADLPGVLFQRYEDIIADPPAAVRQIADHLGIDLRPNEDCDLAEEYSLQSNLRRISAHNGKLSAQGVDPTITQTLHADPHTLLHHNHIRAGAGGWQDSVTPEQLFFLAAVCSDWLVVRGYEADADWPLRVLQQRGWGVAELASCWLEQQRREQHTDPREQVMQQTLDRVQVALARCQEAVALRTKELSDARGHACGLEDKVAGLEALVSGLHGVIADLERQVSEKDAHLQHISGLLDEAKQKERELGRLGPLALGLARRARRLLTRFGRMIPARCAPDNTTPAQ